jgi:copper transport protein
MNLVATFRAIAFAFIAVLAFRGDTRGHAVLVDSVPPDRAVLASPPLEVVLRFNETVMPVALRVLDSEGRAVAAQPPAPSADSIVRAGLPSDLPPGSYLVSWRVVSADAHPIGGAFAFTVGSAGASFMADDQARREAAWKAAVIANRAVGDAALLLAAGGALAVGLVFGAALPRGGRAITVASAIVAMLSALLSVPLARGWIAAAPASALLDLASWTPGADAPHRARTLLIVVGLALVLFVVPGESRAGRLAGCGGALIACAGLPFSGHVAALSPALPGQLALFLHAAGVAFWIGSLPLLALALWQAPPLEALRLLKRFSAFAVVLVAFLIVAGTGVALTRVRDIAALTESGYGRILLFKAGLVALMLALAITNRRLTRAGRGDAATSPLKRNIALEIVLAAAVLVLTAWLGHTRPPEEGHAHAHGPAPGRAFVAVESDGAVLLIEAHPGRRGRNRLIGHMTDASGQPLATRDLVVELALPSAEIEPLAADARLETDGKFVVEAIALPLAGRWSLRVDALIGDFEKRVFTLPLEIE